MKNWCLEVWGDFACFTRPEMKVERVSYDVITPSAARAIFESILWKPAIKWNIVKIEVITPIRWISLRRNEVGKLFTNPSQAHLKGESSDSLGFFVEEHRQQRAGLFLRDVRYRIHGWFDYLPNRQAETPHSDESEAKYAAMFDRRARKGQCFHRPYLGCREFPCEFRLVEAGERLTDPIDRSDDLGWMLYDMNFDNPSEPRPEFFRARLESGIINVDRRDPHVEIRG